MECDINQHIVVKYEQRSTTMGPKSEVVNDFCHTPLFFLKPELNFAFFKLLRQ